MRIGGAGAGKKGTGARALRGLIEKMMLDLMYEIPSSEDIINVKITKAVVVGEDKPIIRRKQNQAAAPEFSGSVLVNHAEEILIKLERFKKNCSPLVS